MDTMTPLEMLKMQLKLIDEKELFNAVNIGFSDQEDMVSKINLLHARMNFMYQYLYFLFDNNPEVLDNPLVYPDVDAKEKFHQELEMQRDEITKACDAIAEYCDTPAAFTQQKDDLLEAVNRSLVSDNPASVAELRKFYEDKFQRTRFPALDNMN